MTREDIEVVTELCALRKEVVDLQAANKALVDGDAYEVKANINKILDRLPQDKHVLIKDIRNVLNEYLGAKR